MGSVYSRSGGAKAPTLITKNITANGTYNASSDNADGYNQVSVNIPLKTKNITANGTFNASSDNAAGYSQVSVNVKATRNLIWSGSSADGVSVNLSAYNWVYVVITPTDGGATGCTLLLQVNGSASCAGIYRPYEGSVRQYARNYQALSSGISALTANGDNMYRISAIYGISDIN